MEGSHEGKVRGIGRPATIVAWTFLGGILAGGVGAIVRVIQGTPANCVSHAIVRPCPTNVWIETIIDTAAVLFIVGSVIAGVTAAVVTARRSRRHQAQGAGLPIARISRVGVGLLLLVVGAVLTLGAVALWGQYPSGITQRYATAIGVTAVISVTLGLLTLVAPPARAEGSLSWAAAAAMAIGVVSLASFVILVLGNASIGSDHTLPTSARIVPVALGAGAVLLGVLGLVRARGNALTIRGSIAALVMGLGSAIVPIWLWQSACYLFETDCL